MQHRASLADQVRSREAPWAAARTNISAVALIGMPGAGKSTVGVLLAKGLGLDFLDTDVAIQVQEKRTLETIVRADGHLGLRRIEAAVVRALQPLGRVLATGGSAVYSAPAMAHLRSYGPLVFLDAPITTLRRRAPDLSERGIAGPPGATLESLAEERVPLYKRHAAITVDADTPSTAVVVDRIVEGLARYAPSPGA